MPKVMGFDEVAYKANRCAICGERYNPDRDELAEMYDPKTLPEGGDYEQCRSGVVHGECGSGSGWEMS